MRKNLWCLLGLIFAVAVVPSYPLRAAELEQRFLGSGVTKRVGGYRPLRAEMDKTADTVQHPPDGLEAPKFGTIELDKKQWAFVIDEPEGKPATLYIDTNGDGDLTNDPKTKWEARKQGEFTTYSGEGQVDLGDGRLGTLGLYRFDPADARRPELKNTLMFYVDFGFEFSLELDGKKFDTFVSGNLDPNLPLPLDRDGNGQISRSYEVIRFDQPFNLTGSTYVLSLNEGKPTLEEAAEEVPQLPLPPDLQIGKPALPFTATTMAAETIEFPKHYAGKIVMLDFWATWCGPCIGEIPNMKAAYSRWNKVGFEILGISFDAEGEEEKIKAFLEKNELPWSQIYEGKQWDTTLGRLHDVSGIPFVLLVDGDSGNILATSRELRGPGWPAWLAISCCSKACRRSTAPPPIGRPRWHSGNVPSNNNLNWRKTPWINSHELNVGRMRLNSD
jgi:thiol-disulfide isomerase/thioredoxin